MARVKNIYSLLDDDKDANSDMVVVIDMGKDNNNDNLNIDTDGFEIVKTKPSKKSKNQNLIPLTKSSQLSKLSKPKVNSIKTHIKKDKIPISNVDDHVININSKIYHGLKISPNGILDESSDLPKSIDEAIRMKRNMTLKQIISIVHYDNIYLYGLWGEMLNIIHDRIQLKVKKHRIKIVYGKKLFLVSLYNWYDLKKIEFMIEEIIFG